MAAHKELITLDKFDGKFKRALLDYYSYGFKSKADFTQSQKTVLDDWKRLNSVIVDYFEWSETRGRVLFASADSQSMEENPFHRIYRFCKYTPFTNPAYFFHAVVALSPAFSLQFGGGSLGAG